MKLASKASFTRQQLHAPPVPVATRLRDCPTLKSFSKCWQRVQQLPGPAADELLLFTASGEAASAEAPELQQLGQQARSVFDDHLQESGAVLLRGLPITSGDACEAFVTGLGYSLQSYEPYGGVRQKIGSLDAATNVGPAELLDLHNEMCYNPRPNAKIMLVCLQPAKEGGESLMGDTGAIAAAMPEHVLDRFVQRGGVRYTRTYVSAHAPPGTLGPNSIPALSWQERTGLTDPDAAAAFFTALGFRTEWGEFETLVATHVAPAVVPDPSTGQPVWFNLTHLAVPGWTDYGDGSAIEPETVTAICEARLSATRALQLGAGDVLMLDNYRCAHGRLPYDASEGRSLVAVLTSN